MITGIRRLKMLVTLSASVAAISLTAPVLIQTGYFDLACPYRTAEYAVEHLAVTEAVRSNASIADYDAGHMMYVHPPSMQKFKNDLAAFVDANAR